MVYSIKKQFSLLISLSFLCLTAQAGERLSTGEFGRLEAKKYSNVEAVKAVYSKSFTNAVKGLPDAAAFQNLSSKMLWGVAKSDGTVYSLETGQSPQALFVIYDLIHPKLKEKGVTLQTSGESQPMILMRPDEMTEDLAGIFLIHELSHVLDILNKTESADSAVNELRAYAHQKIAANAISGGKFDKALDEVLKKHKIINASDLVKIKAKESKKFDSYLDPIDKALAKSAPASLAEAEMRLGFYILALEIRRQENSKGFGNVLDGKSFGTVLSSMRKSK
jgi:hypothetical protein